MLFKVRVNEGAGGKGCDGDNSCDSGMKCLRDGEIIGHVDTGGCYDRVIAERTSLAVASLVLPASVTLFNLWW